MTKNPEYPDLEWVPPRAWQSTPDRRPKWIVVHTTEGAKNGLAAENGAIYNQNRTDSTSCHYHVDNNSVVQSVRSRDVSYCAFPDGNFGGIQYELCTQANSANWTDDYHSAMLDLAAQQIARDCVKWGIEVRRLTVPQLQGKSMTGFCGHGDISNAFEGDHYDPGAKFPWTRFLGMVQDKINGEDDDMPKLDDELYNGAAPNKSWTSRFPGSDDTMKNVWAFAAMYAKDGAENSAKLIETFGSLLTEQKRTNTLLEQLLQQGKK